MSTPPRQELLAGTLFDIPDPPTGPAKMPSQPNTFAGYLAWRRSDAGLKVWRAIEDEALRRLAHGDRRVSPKGLVEWIRAAGNEINNTHTAWLADDLCRRHPELIDVIERRARRKHG